MCLRVPCQFILVCLFVVFFFLDTFPIARERKRLKPNQMHGTLFVHFSSRKLSCGAFRLLCECWIWIFTKINFIVRLVRMRDTRCSEPKSNIARGRENPQNLCEISCWVATCLDVTKNGRRRCRRRRPSEENVCMMWYEKPVVWKRTLNLYGFSCSSIAHWLYRNPAHDCEQLILPYE